MQITSEKFTGNMFGLSRKSLYIQRTLVVLLSTGFFLGLPIQAFAQDKIPPALMLEGADIEAARFGLFGGHDRRSHEARGDGER